MSKPQQNPETVRIMELTFIKDKLEQAQALATKGKHTIGEDIAALVIECQRTIDDPTGEIAECQKLSVCP